MLVRSLVLFFLTAPAMADPVRQIRPDDATGTSAAIVVDGAANLAHTEQILPIDAGGKVIAPDRADEQAAAVLDRLETTLKGVQSGLDHLVKVDAYLARPDAVAPFQKAFAQRMAGKARPAVSYVVGSLSRPEALVALDAIAVTPVSGTKVTRSVRVLPSGPRVYVSGQIDAGNDLATATRNTLEGLGVTLKYLGLERSQVIRVKGFTQPVTATAAAHIERELAAFFGSDDVPPVTLVDGSASRTMPIEIELIVAGRDSGASPLEYVTPPALKSSPVFSRVVRVNSGPLIYVSNLYGPSGATGGAQVEAIFEKLSSLLAEAGSDLGHLVKAMYYVTDEPTTTALGQLRARYYDPKRPPGASKAAVIAVGTPGRTVTLDMIAVPAIK